MTADQIDVWREMVCDMSFEEFKRGIVVCLRDYKYAGFPPVGIIRQAAGLSAGAIDGDSAAVLAWGTVLQAMRAHGGYVSINWPDPAIPAAIKICAGSWARLCETEIGELHTWTKKSFCEAYKSAKTARLTETVSPGILATDAGRLGGSQPEPKRLGETLGAAYGFGDGSAQPRLTGPAAEVALSMSIADESRPPIVRDVMTGQDETAEQFESRKRKMAKRLGEKFGVQCGQQADPTLDGDEVLF